MITARNRRRSTCGPSSATSSPRSTTASTRRRSPPASSPRPGPTWPPRSSPPSARSPARCTAAPPTAPSPRSTRSATRSRIDDWVRGKLAAGERIMGFGHAVYRTEDPRARMLRETALQLGGELVDFACAVEERVVAILAEAKPDRRLLHQRRVLRGRRDGALRHPARHVHPDVRGQQGRRLGGERAGAVHRAADHPTRGPLRRPTRPAARPRQRTRRTRSPLLIRMQRAKPPSHG